MTYDTIKLQDALDTLDKIGSLDTPEDRKYAREMFLNIPSALPEHLTDEDLETIRIHLHAFMEGLCNQHRWKEAEEYERIIVRLKYLAQTGQWIFKDDTISRQEAIDVIKAISNLDEKTKGGIIATFSLLDSAQPKRKNGRWIKPTGMMPPEHHGHYECSECGAWAMRPWLRPWKGVVLTDFCPACGIPMLKDGEG